MGYIGGSPLIMFFYGTLKRGQRNHERFCGGALRVEVGAVRGDLFDVRLGYPALVVPEESIWAFGTGDYRRDAQEHQRPGRGPSPLLEGPRVFGEIFAFDDPESRLPDLDRLEGFDPADTSSHYRRVLLPVETIEGSGLLAWAYVVEQSSGSHLPGGRWPP
ncbi:MAG TPA: gamma-glutamylcyclotransferase family protein, partial [Rubrobacter sp.]|nr:gamma-glutamylcyclotransferase family protein [Rubrobacter sp.]